MLKHLKINKMEKTKNIRLNLLSVNKLRNKHLDALKGGSPSCSCSCYYPEISSDEVNGNSNYYIGENGGHSTQGCNQYYVSGVGDWVCGSCDEDNPGIGGPQ